jgi:hypothetical protein
MGPPPRRDQSMAAMTAHGILFVHRIVVARGNL